MVLQILLYQQQINAKAGLSFSETAHKAGFEDGDIPIKADGKELTTLSGDMIRNIAEAKNVEVIRNGKTETITMPDEFMLKLIGANEKFASFRNPVVVKEAIKGTEQSKPDCKAETA